MQAAFKTGGMIGAGSMGSGRLDRFELDAFVRLARGPATCQRIEHNLDTGKSQPN